MDLSVIFLTIFLHLPRPTHPEESSSVNSNQHRTVSASLDDLLTSSDSEEIIRKLAILTTPNENDKYTPEDVAKVANLLSKCDAEILSNIQNWLENMQALVDVVSNLQEIDSTILKMSNSLYGATNNILTYAIQIIHGGFSYVGYREISSKNFFLIIDRQTRIGQSSHSTYVLLKDSASGEHSFAKVATKAEYIESIEYLSNFNENSNLELALKTFKEYNEFNSYTYIIAAVFITPKLFITQKEVNFVGKIVHAYFIDLNWPLQLLSDKVDSGDRGYRDTRVPAANLEVTYKSGSYQKLDCNFWNGLEQNIGNTGPFWDKDTTEADLLIVNETVYPICRYSSQAVLKNAAHFAMLAPTITDMLEYLLYSNKSTSEKMSRLSEISERSDEFQPGDIELIARILEKVSWDPDIDLNDLSSVINNVLGVDRDVLGKSQANSQATDLILKQIDKILINHRYDQMQGTHIMETNFKIIISNTTMTGVLLFNDYNVVEIYDAAIEDWSKYKNVISGVRLNSELKQCSDSKIIVTIFLKDSLFNAEKHRDLLNHVYGVILPPKFEHESPLSLIQNQSLLNDHKQGCTFWNYGSSAGFWQIDLTSTLNTVNDLSICDFWHTTHFACLLLDNSDLNAKDIKILDWITTINCGLSIFGISFIFLTAVLFKKWRSNSGNRILINFAIALAFQIAAFYISDAVNNVLDPNLEKSLTCTISGVLLHYSIISQFCWMLVISFLQYKRFVKVLGGPPNHLMLKSSLCGWILPILPVILVLASDSDNYVHSQVGLCYPSGLGLYLGVWLPVIAILITNVVLFLLIVYHVTFSKSQCANVASDDVFYQWRLAALLFFMLGVNWVFGFLCQIDSDVVFVYFFTLTATLQGFLMFLFFVAFHGTTKSLYSKAIQRVYDNFSSDEA